MKFKPEKLSILTFVVACFGLFGCTTVNTVERAEPVGQKQMVGDKRIQTDSSLGRRVQVVGVNESTGPGGLLNVQVEVHNGTGSLQHFNYRFEWYDMEGMLVSKSTSAFIPRQIEGKESIMLSATAPVPAARDFRLKLIENP